MWKKRLLSTVLAVTVLAAGPACAEDEDDDPGPGTEQDGDGGGGLDY